MCTFIEQIRYDIDCMYLKGKCLWQLSLEKSCFFGFTIKVGLEVLVLRTRTVRVSNHMTVVLTL